MIADTDIASRTKSDNFKRARHSLDIDVGDSDNNTSEP